MDGYIFTLNDCLDPSNNPTKDIQRVKRQKTLFFHKYE